MATETGRRRKKGTGGIKPVREGVWLVDVEVPREPGLPRRRRSRMVHGTITDAERVLAELRAGPPAAAEMFSADASPPKAEPAPSGRGSRRGRRRETPRDDQRSEADAELAKTPIKRRRKRGSGGVFQIRDGVWKVDVEVSRDPITGRRRRASRHVYGTREDAEVALARLKVADHEKRLPTGGTNARSVSAAFLLYQQAIDAGLVELAPSTIATVRSASKIMSATQLSDGRRFGDIRLSRLTWQDIEYLYAAMRGRGLSAAYIRRCATVLARALEVARKRGLIDSNPAKDAARPRTSRSKPFAPTGEEMRALLAEVQRREPEMGDAGTILASTGMRRGEFLALRWSDVDLDRGEIHVAAAVTDAGPGLGVVRKTTKKSDWRDVPLTAAALDAFRRQAERRKVLLGADPDPDEYVFPGPFDSRTPMRPDDFSNRWAAARGSSPITLLHLRHYTATAMLDAGESYRTVADILGNSEATLRLHYDGRTDVGKRRAIAALEL